MTSSGSGSGLSYSRFTVTGISRDLAEADHVAGSGPSTYDALPSLPKSLEAPVRRAAARNYQSESGRLRPGLEQYAAPLNCEEAIKEYVEAQLQAQEASSSPLSDTMQKVVDFCWAVTGLGRDDLASLVSKPSTTEGAPSNSREGRRAAAAIENPFAGLPDSELAQLGAEEGLFSGLAETLTFLYKEYVQELQGEGERAHRRAKRIADARNFFARTVVRMRRNGQMRLRWAEGPSEIQWWELLHQTLLAERRHEGLEEASSYISPSSPQETDQEDTEGEEIMQESEALQLLHQRVVDEMPKDASAGGSAWPSGSDAVLVCFKEFVSRPELAADLNRGSLGPRILTARQWTHARNVLFELLGAAGTMEVWGPSSERLQGEMLKSILSEAAHPAELGALPERRTKEDFPVVSQTSDEMVSYYSKGRLPRVVLSERMLLLQLAKRCLGRLTQHQLCKKSGLALSLWVSREANEEEVLGPLRGGAAVPPRDGNRRVSWSLSHDSELFSVS